MNTQPTSAYPRPGSAALPVGPVHAAPSLWRAPLTSVFHGDTAQAHDPLLSSTRAPGPQGRTLMALKAPPAPSLLDRALAARPEVACALALDAWIPATHTRLHALMLGPKLADHPGAILAIGAISAAALGTITTLTEVGDTASTWLVAWPLETVGHRVKNKAGRISALPLILLRDGACITLGLSTRCIATACGATAGILTGFLLGPVLLILPRGIEAPIADALLAYLRLQKHFARAEQAIKQWNPFHSQPEPHQKQHFDLSHALDALHNELTNLTGMTPTTQSPATTATGASPTPQTRFQRTYQSLLAQVTSHPILARRAGLPTPPTRAQAQPVHQRLLAHLLHTQPEQTPNHVLD